VNSIAVMPRSTSPSRRCVIVAEAAVLVLHLDTDHPAAAVGLPADDDRHQRVEPRIDMVEIGRIAGPQRRGGSMIVQQPGRKPAVVPFGADVRPRPHQNVEVGLRGQVEEPADFSGDRDLGRCRCGWWKFQAT
jgi:hypothetical protein